MRSIDELATEICTLAGRINAANHQFLTLIAEFDRRNGWFESGMQSMIRTAPSWVSNSVSKIRVPSRYLRRTPCAAAAGAISQRPCSGSPSKAAKHAPESNRGRQSQSMEPSRPTNAAVWQSPISA